MEECFQRGRDVWRERGMFAEEGGKCWGKSEGKGLERKDEMGKYRVSWKVVG